MIKNDREVSGEIEKRNVFLPQHLKGVLRDLGLQIEDC
jgi:hypothetical protein